MKSNNTVEACLPPDGKNCQYALPVLSTFRTAPTSYISTMAEFFK